MIKRTIWDDLMLGFLPLLLVALLLLTDAEKTDLTNALTLVLSGVIIVAGVVMTWRAARLYQQKQR